MITIAGCQDSGDPDAMAAASAYIGTTGAIPGDATCTHIIATRLADFAVSEYRGVLSGGVFSVLPGETRVTATAYPQPCTSESTQPPWLADVQVTTFSSGANTLVLHFRENTSVTIDPVFDDNNAPEVVIRGGSPVRTGRNGEDAAGPGFALDGWEVKRITVPPAAPSETVMFSTQGKGGLAFSPRGLAALPDGTFLVQLNSTTEAVRQFDAAGTFLASLPVVYPGTAIRFDTTDGIEAIDATHLVRTAYLTVPVGCDADGAHCIQAGLELLERGTGLDGGPTLRVARQILMPELPGQPLNVFYPLGVTPVGGRFAVTSIPNDGSSQLLTLLEADGTVAAGPVAVAGSVEGLFVSADGRIGALDYHGHLTMHDPVTLAERPGETAFYRTGLDFPLVASLAWDSAVGSFLALTTENRLAFATPDFGGVADVGIDLSSYVSPQGIEYRADTNQLAIVDRVPPFESATGQRVPAVDFYDLTSRALVQRLRLRDTALPARTLSVAFDPVRRHLLTNYRRPGNVADSTLDAVVYVHNLDGSLAGTFDLAPLGFARVQSVNYQPATDELIVAATDSVGVPRLVVTSLTGQPRRSYRLDAIGDVVEVAAITSGPSAGDLGAAENQPSSFFQLSLQ